MFYANLRSFLTLSYKTLGVISSGSFLRWVFCRLQTSGGTGKETKSERLNIDVRFRKTLSESFSNSRTTFRGAIFLNICQTQTLCPRRMKGIVCRRLQAGTPTPPAWILTLASSLVSFTFNNGFYRFYTTLANQPRFYLYRIYRVALKNCFLGL